MSHSHSHLIGYCANCSKEQIIVQPILRSGHKVWLCIDCLRQLGIKPYPKAGPQKETHRG